MTPEELAPEAFQEALRRYPGAVEKALIFFAYAGGLGQCQPSEEDITWAREVMARKAAAHDPAS